VTRPDPQQSALYDALYPVYRDMARSARPGWSALAQLRARHRTL